MFIKSLALPAALMLPGLALADTQATSWTDLNLRAGPGPTYQVIGVIPANSSVAVVGCLAEGALWCQVTSNGQTGWAAGNYLTASVNNAAVPLTQAGNQVVGTVTYTSDDDATKTGAAGGAIAGAAVGGPVGALIGAAIGGVSGAAVDSANPDERVVTYVRQTPAQPVYLEGEVVVGAGIPNTVQLSPVPDSTYSYAYVNGLPVLVNPQDRRIVYIVR